jgi:hypothetical protein
LNYNFLERQVLRRGHWLDSPANDYGIDATMFHHNRDGEIENGEVRFQLKASDSLKVGGNGDWIAQRVETRDIRYWYFELYPVILAAYDAGANRAYWLHVQQYVAERPTLMDSTAARTTVRISVRNKLTIRAIDQFRSLSLAIMA